MNEITINGRLPTLNEYLAAYGRNRYIAGNLKREATEFVAWQVKQLPKIETPAKYIFTWYIKDKRTDPDNIASAVKYIFDGLVTAGKLENDNLKWITGIEHHFIIDSNERVKIQLVP